MDWSFYEPFFGKGIFVDKETFLKRKSICQECPMVIMRKFMCGKCYCPIVNISALKQHECPMGFWPKLEISDQESATDK